MRKRSNRAARWGLQVSALCLALLLFSIIGMFAVTTKTFAFQQQSAAVNAKTPTAQPTKQPTAKPTKVPIKTPTPKPQPTTMPTQAPPAAAPTTVAVGAGNGQPVVPTPAAPTPTDPTPMATSAATATATTTPAVTPAPTGVVSAANTSQQQSGGLFGRLFSTLGVVVILLVLAAIAGVALLLLRLRRGRTTQQQGAMAAQRSVVTPMPLNPLPPVTPMPSAFPMPATPLAQPEYALANAPQNFNAEAMQAPVQSLSPSPFMHPQDLDASSTMAVPTTPPAIPFTAPPAAPGETETGQMRAIMRQGLFVIPERTAE